ncbi:D-2-hydroxyacid dehydrogenase [Cellulomonas triticagri]|uniref:D-2-hydroxyacid dehydrogenase n=1 Tax=Cellulomonas triticagri TaxID=2483352 RepID=A0A3M2JBA6_9CELL|nr:D-2-hydroxyacid dehydrogenase [Cellulomonas triticagri]RMI08793.1 D-2-hydroxyacid dehydrogenase [Cellulomonas triticagri]
MTAPDLRVVVATPLPDDLHALVVDRTGVDLVREPDLLPPMRWPGDFGGDPAFRRTPEQQARFDALLDSADVLYGIPDVSPAALARTVRANPRLRWVQAMAAGSGAQVRAAGLTAAELDRVVVTTSAGVHAGPLAEFALLGLLAGAKQVPRLRADQRDHRWPGRWSTAQVADQTVVVVGLGHIGVEVARLAAALGARVVGVNKSAKDVPGVERVLPPDRLAEAVAAADAVVVTLPGTEATHHLVSAEVLAAFRPGTTFVSVGRGTVVDEAALVRAIEDGRVGYAALDVFEVEPLPASSPLWDLPQVLVSPHTAANSPAEERRIAELFCDNVDRFREGRPLRNVVDTHDFY